MHCVFKAMSFVGWVLVHRPVQFMFWRLGVPTLTNKEVNSMRHRSGAARPRACKIDIGVRP